MPSASSTTPKQRPTSLLLQTPPPASRVASRERTLSPNSSTTSRPFSGNYLRSLAQEAQGATQSVSTHRTSLSTQRPSSRRSSRGFPQHRVSLDQDVLRLPGPEARARQPPSPRKKTQVPKPPQCRLPTVSGASCMGVADGRSAEHIVSAALGLSFCFVGVVIALLLLLLGQVILFSRAVAEWSHVACDQPLAGWLIGFLLVAVITLLLTVMHQLTGDPLVDDVPSPFSPGCCLWVVQAFAVLWVLFGTLLYATSSACNTGLSEFTKWALVWASLGAPIVLGCIVSTGACFGSTALASASALGMLEGEKDSRRASLPKMQPSIPMMRRGATKEVIRLLCNLKARESALQSLAGSYHAEESKSAALGKQMADQLALLEEQSEQMQEQLALIRYQSQLMESSHGDMLAWREQQQKVLRHICIAVADGRERRCFTDDASSSSASGCTADEATLPVAGACCSEAGKPESDTDSQTPVMSSCTDAADASPQAAWTLTVEHADERAVLVENPDPQSDIVSEEDLEKAKDLAVEIDAAALESTPGDDPTQLDDLLPEAKELAAAGNSQVDVEIESTRSHGAGDVVHDPWDCPWPPV